MTQKRMSYSLLQKIRALDPSLAPAPYLSDFWYVFSDLKPDGCITRALQNFFAFQRQRCTNQRF